MRTSIDCGDFDGCAGGVCFRFNCRRYVEVFALMFRSFSNLLVYCLVLMVSTVVWVCPFCAGREESSGELILMFSMILLLFGIVGVVYKVIKWVAMYEEVAQVMIETLFGEC